MEPILQIENLTHTYSEGTPFQRSAVEGLSMTVGAGEFLGIIGHTGSGKSTLIQHLNGLLQPTSGRILLAGKDIWAEPKKIREVRCAVGLVFQYPEYQLFEETCYKDIAFGPKNMGLDEEDYGVQSGAADTAAAIQEKTAFLPDYAFSNSDRAAGTTVSGLVGSGMVAGLAALICVTGGFFRKKKATKSV